MHQNKKVPYFVGFLSIVTIIAIGIASVYNKGAAYDARLKAEYSNSENILSQYSQKVLEASQVPGMMRDDLIEITKVAIGGRYGPDGSKAVFQMMREKNPQVSPQLYLKIQQIIESGRDEYKNSQTKFLDIKRVYETELNSLVSGPLLKMAGYPKIPLDQYKLISTSHGNDSFSKGLEPEPLTLRK